MQVMITAPELAEQMHKDVNTVYQWAKRKDDPLPLRYMDGNRYGAILVSEFEEWWKRNAELTRPAGR